MPSETPRSAAPAGTVTVAAVAAAAATAISSRFMLPLLLWWLVDPGRRAGGAPVPASSRPPFRGTRGRPARARAARLRAGGEAPASRLVFLPDLEVARHRSHAFGVARDGDGLVGIFLASDAAAQDHRA